METNVVFPGETNAEGLYNIPNLPPGTYRVIVQKFAFRTVVKPDVELHVQDVVAHELFDGAGLGRRRASRWRQARR